MALVLDTGPLLALLDTNDRDHARCLAMANAVREDFVVPSHVLVELNYWLRMRRALRVWRAFVEDLAGGAYRQLQLDEDGLVRAADLEAQYEDLRLGFVDASVIVTCEMLGETKLATLDHRHFSVVRPRHCESLALLPT